MLSARTSRRLDGIAKCSKNGHPVKDVFNLMTNYPDLWMQAYLEIKANAGAVTPGIDDDTLDGFSEQRVARLIDRLRAGTYKPKPVRRTYIPKRNGKRRAWRPLGIPGGNDKLVQSVVRLILERIYEPVFSEHSHGFRPGRSCHTALKEIQRNWTGVKWIIEADIKGFYDNIDHNRLIKALQTKIDDRKFIRLMWAMLKAGYMEEWVWHKTYSGVPQGGIVSPIMANVYLHELDTWVAAKIKAFNQGKRRSPNPEYRQLIDEKHRIRQRLKKRKAVGLPVDSEKQRLKELETAQHKLSSVDPMDPNYRRLLYCRYADDFQLGVIGSRKEAQAVLAELQAFIENDLKLTFAVEKTRVNHASKGTRFLGFDIKTYTADRVVYATYSGTRTRARTISGQVTLSIPKDKIRRFLKDNRIGVLNTQKARHRPLLTRIGEVEIFLALNAELRGFANYYSIADRAKRELAVVEWMYHECLAKTLAKKRKITKAKAYQLYRVGRESGMAIAYTVKGKPRLCHAFKLKELATAKAQAKELDQVANPARYTKTKRSELLTRLNAEECEYCGATAQLEVHHVRKLANIQKGKEAWQQLMIARRRKTLCLCAGCHKKLHAGTLPSPSSGALTAMW
jgi:RNA-directed DNA polymerase